MESRCVIVTAYMEGDPKELYHPAPGDFVLCADGGYAYAQMLGIVPSLVIGDCDSPGSAGIPPELLQRVPVEKDDTDTMLCIKHALKNGYSHITVLGGIGGRQDHTYANIQSLAYAHTHGAFAEILSLYERVFFLENSGITLPKQENTALSVFAYGGQAEGVYESGVQYPLENATLTPDFPLGVSNKITEPAAHVSVRKGRLLIMLSRLER